MKHVDLSNTLATEMDKVLNSGENKELFSSSSMLEKLAFKKVSEQDEVSELETELLKKNASCCECGEEKKHECHCECHKDEKKASVRNPAREAFNALLRVSEDLETAGFERLAAASVMLAGKLMAEAKAKSSKKPEKSKSKDEKSKSKGKKMDMKERMEKMRKMQKGKGKKSDKKDDKKSSKK